MIINHNIPALNSYNNLSRQESSLSKSLEKLSSGMRINKAGDDAAGLAISEKMRAQIRGLDRAKLNTQDAISMLQTGEGSLQEVQNMLSRMRELAVQAASDTNSDEDRQQLQGEVDQLSAEVDRIASVTNFNGRYLLNGSMQGVVNTVAGSLSAIVSNQTLTPTVLTGAANSITNNIGSNETIQIKYIRYDTVANAAVFSVVEAYGNIAAANFSVTSTGVSINSVVSAGVASLTSVVSIAATAVWNPGDTLTVVFNSKVAAFTTDNSIKIQIGTMAGQWTSLSMGDMRSRALGLRDSVGGTLDVTTQLKAQGCLGLYDRALSIVTRQRSALGAVENRMEVTASALTSQSENMSAAESRIRDVDMASEMMNFTKTQILQQSANAMLAQANQLPSSVLSLLK